jgi:hypothetical protein
MPQPGPPAEDAKEDVLDDVLGGVPVAGDPKRRAVEPAELRLNDRLEGSSVPGMGPLEQSSQFLHGRSKIPWKDEADRISVRKNFDRPGWPDSGWKQSPDSLGFVLDFCASFRPGMSYAAEAFVRDRSASASFAEGCLCLLLFATARLERKEPQCRRVQRRVGAVPEESLPGSSRAMSGEWNDCRTT